ncbi:MAG: hypothetical protein P8X63_07570, partial [Desulfuromonadaceae bacterium]
TNLAVYLKALDEELPVTLVSFDKHFNVDDMFAIGAQRGKSVARLFQGDTLSQLAVLGEYGVQFLASAGSLQPPGNDPRWLGATLARSGMSGILLLDTSSVLDYFTWSALLAADLVLVPIRDRFSLHNTAALARILKKGGRDPERMWLLPSLLGEPLRLRDQLWKKDALIFAAEEGGYQILDFAIARGAEVGCLDVPSRGRIRPVLTRARRSLMHRQLRELAQFVQDHFRAAKRPRKAGSLAFAEDPVNRFLRLHTSCPACGEGMSGAKGQFFQDFRSRRRGFIHRHCLLDLLDDLGFDDDFPGRGMLGLSTTPGERTVDETALSACLYDERGLVYCTQVFPEFADSGFADCWRQISGRYAEGFQRDYLLIGVEEVVPERFFAADVYPNWNRLRRKVLRNMLKRAG